MINISLIVYIALIIILLLVCDNRYSKKYYVPIKSACSASFLIIYIVNEFYGPDITRLLLPLIACFVGDILMGEYNIKHRKRFLGLAMAAFILGHIGFLAYMVSLTEYTSLIVIIGPIIACLIFYFVYRLMHLHMGYMKIGAYIYTLFISAVFLKSIETSLVCGESIFIMLGGVLFFLSDFSILFLYFYHFKNKNSKKLVHYFNLVTYYLAIYCFIL